MDKLTFPANVILAGATKSGKTYLTKQIINDHLIPTQDYIIVISPTASVSSDFEEFDQKYTNFQVHTEPEKFMAVVSETIGGMKKLSELYKKQKSRVPFVTLIVDDCLGLNILKRGGLLDKISVSSRHFRLSIFLLVQKLTAVPRTFRLNSRYVFFFNATNFKELESVLEEYTPRAYKKKLLKYIEMIFNIPHTFIMSDNFENKLRNRLWLNGKENLMDKLESVEGWTAFSRALVAF